MHKHTTLSILLAQRKQPALTQFSPQTCVYAHAQGCTTLCTEYDMPASNPKIIYELLLIYWSPFQARRLG